MVARRLFLILFILSLAANSGWSPRRDRYPAVAGQFYPADPKELKTTLQTLLRNGVPSKHLGRIAAIIAPHASYVYSGAVAASAFNQINPSKPYDNVFILGSSHQVAFEGASVYATGDFITPLGTVHVNRELAGQLVRKYSFFSDRTDAHETEHSIEVQLPFLQERLKKLTIVPIILGTRSPDVCKKIADALRPYFTPQNLFVISSDFSHYPRYEDAVAVDKATADAVCSKSSENFLAVLKGNASKDISNLATSSCGWTSILTLLFLVERDPVFAIHQIQYKNSGNTEFGGRTRVVGYHAIVVSVAEAGAPATFNLGSRDKKELLAMARTTIEQYLRKSKIPEIDTIRLSGNLKTACGAFVTLRKHGELRGCIGQFDPDEPLFRVVQSMAVAASTEDHRFLPVTAEELDAIEVEISVLTPLRRISTIGEIEMGKHGIYIKKGMRTGTFLPQVAAETGWSREEFVAHCAQDKAGIGWDGWKDAELFVYEAIVFSEHDSGR